MLSKVLLLAPAALELAVLITVSVGAAAAPPSPKLTIEGAANGVAVDFEHGALVLVKNAGDKEGQPSLQGDIPPGEYGCALTVSATPTRIPAKQEALIRVAVSTPAPCWPATYKGRLRLTNGDSTVDLNIQVPNLTVAKTWKAVIYRRYPGAAQYLDDRLAIPVQGIDKIALPSRAEFLLPRDSGEWLFGRGFAIGRLASSSKVDDASNIRLLWFHVSGAAQAGKYTGEIKIPGTDGATKMELDVKDIVLWPVLVTLCSILLTLGVQKWISVKRPAWQWRSRIAVAETGLNKAIKKTNGRAHGYDIQAGFAKSAREVQADIDGFASTANPTAASQNQIEAAVTQLEKLPVAWTAFVDALNQLDVVLQALPPALQNPPADAAAIGQTSPFFVEDAKRLLNGTEMSLGQWQATVTFLASTLSLISSLLPLAAQASRYAAMPGLPPPTAVLVEQVKSKLWRVKTTDDLGRLMIPADLDAIALQVLTLVHAAGLPGPKLAFAAGILGSPIVFTPFEPAEATARRIARRLAHTGWLLTLLAILLAELMGLHDYYFDSAFGSLKDYATLILYGTGTKLALDLAHVSLDTLLGRTQLPGSA